MDIHQKFIERWAKIYVTKLLKNKDEAREWSHRFLPEAFIEPVAQASKKLLKKRGFKVLE